MQISELETLKIYSWDILSKQEMTTEAIKELFKHNNIIRISEHIYNPKTIFTSYSFRHLLFIKKGDCIINFENKEIQLVENQFIQVDTGFKSTIIEGSSTCEYIQVWLEEFIN